MMLNDDANKVRRLSIVAEQRNVFLRQVQQIQPRRLESDIYPPKRAYCEEEKRQCSVQILIVSAQP